MEFIERGSARYNEIIQFGTRNLLFGVEDRSRFETVDHHVSGHQ